MTRLPTETWDVTPRPDLDPYEANTICPITGETDALEDHHIWRRSFTALGKEGNEALFWVEVEGQVLPSRVWLAPGVHRLITENRASIYVEDGVFYYEDSEMVEPLNPQPGPQGSLIHSHRGIAPGHECPTCHRRVPKPREIEGPRKRGTWSVKIPKKTADGEEFQEDGAEVLDALLAECRARLAPVLGLQGDVPAYFVLVPVLYDWLNDHAVDDGQA